MKKKSAITPNVLRKIVRRITGEFSPEKIILFGSFARGTQGKDSDVDLLVVMACTGSKREKQIELRLALHDIHFPKDVIVATPSEYVSQRLIPGSIARSAYREGKVLFAKAA